MSTATKRRFLTGWCTPGNVAWQHQTCSGSCAGVKCGCECHAMPLETAVAIVASHALAFAVERIEWDDYPDIGEYDWERVAAEMRARAPYPPAEAYGAACVLLESRVEAI